MRCFRSWNQMMQRCTNPNNSRWKDYGGRGITVAGRWHKFPAFYADMGECPDGLTLERNDNEKGYSKANCRWATRKEQQANRRNSKPVSTEPPKPKMSALDQRHAASLTGAQVSKERRRAASDAAIAKIKDRWPLPSKDWPTRLLLAEAGLTRNTVQERLGKRPIAQYLHERTIKRRKARADAVG